MNAATASSGVIQAGPPGLRPRDANGWGPGMALAFGVHLMLVAALALGVHWKINNPEPIEAEVWAEIPKAAAPEPEPSPPPVEEAKPVEKVAEATPAVEPEPVVQEPIPDLVVRKLSKKERKKLKQHETVEVFETAPPKVAAKAEKLPEPKKKPVPSPDKPVVSKVTQPDTSAKDKADREAQHKAQMQRMMTELGTLGTSESAGPNAAAYAGRIKARIKANLRFTGTVSDNPTAVIEVHCAPDGRIIGRTTTQSSGVPAFDDAVLRAIDRTEVLPANENGKVPPVIELTFRPNDL